MGQGETIPVGPKLGVPRKVLLGWNLYMYIEHTSVLITPDLFSKKPTYSSTIYYTARVYPYRPVDYGGREIPLRTIPEPLR